MSPWLSPRTSWLRLALGLVVTALLAALAAGYVSAQRRVDRLEAELRQFYGREAELLTRIKQQEEQIRALTAERDALLRRAPRPPRRPAPPRRPPPPHRRTPAKPAPRG